MSRLDAAALKAARAHLCRLLEITPGRLGTIRDLATGCGVSKATMERAVAALVAEGVLAGGSGRPLRQTGKRPINKPAASRGTKSEAIASRIRQELIASSYQPRSLPSSLKELASRYGACYRTIRGAAEMLVEAGVLEHHKRGYRVRFPRGVAHGGTIALVARGTAVLDGISIVTDRTRTQIMALESLCACSGIACTTHSLYYGTEGFQRSPELDRLFLRPDRAPGLLGIVFLTTAVPSEWIVRTLRDINVLRKPVGVINDAEVDLAPLAAEACGRFRVAAPAYDERAGETMARYLISLGHRHFVYMSTDPHQGVGRSRLAGVRCVLGAVPGECSLTVCEPSSSAPKPLSVDERLAFVRDVTHALEKRLGRVPVKGGLDGRALIQVRDEVEGTVRQVETRERVASLVPQALANPRVTCCVASRDIEALSLIDELSERGISVPGQMSVAAFDDSAAAAACSLTSYNFSDEAVMAHLVDHITASQRRGGRPRDWRLRVEGEVRERRSTGPAPRPARRASGRR